MCGILGHSHISKCVQPGVFAMALGSLVHRGPDHQGSFVSDEISLGAVRLRILDLLSQEAVSAAGLRWTFVEHLLSEHLERRANAGYHLWGLMVLLIWMKRWNIQMGSAKAIAPMAVETLDEVGSLSQLLASSSLPMPSVHLA
jgi:hypothetical protein